jgi:hypothetical protein
MKNVFLVGILMMGFAGNVQANLSLEGHYQGKNLYVQSPESEDGFGFCISRVTVNGTPISSNVQTSAFQINFAELNIQVGEAILVVLEHEDGCHPKVINPEVILPKSTFVLQDIKCTPEGSLQWSTTGEDGKLPFIIEQYKWNKWIAVGEVDGTGISTLNNYKFTVIPHSGENKVRVVQEDNTGKKHVSDEVTFTAVVPEPEMKTIDGQRLIEFVAAGKRVDTKYEVFDAYGNIVKKGYNQTIDYSNLKQGVYYVNYDNKNGKVIVKG